jgi:hypothetical protein
MEIISGNFSVGITRNLFFVYVGTDRLSWFFAAISSPTDRRKEKPTGQAIQA